MSIQNFSLDYFTLKGKVAVVTGGGGGLGQAYAVALAKAGASLFIVTHTNGFDETKRLIEETGQKAVFYQGDLSVNGEPERVIQSCLNEYGKIDILVNNAGIIRRHPLLEYPEADWQMVMNVNLHALYLLSQEAAKIMVKQKEGKIINVCSMLSFQGGKFVPSYTASKHAVAGLTKAFANELAEHNIQINGIAPGYVKTANTKPLQEDEQRNAEILSRIPAQRWAETDDLMGAVVFLASRASNYMNGHILAVDGGWLAR